MDRSAASERVRQFARDAGFEIFGVATLLPATTGDAYRRWLERGENAGMEWMARNVEIRVDPRRLLPGARSALVVGWRYPDQRDEAVRLEGDLWSRVARYARGKDYHQALRSRLEPVAARIRETFSPAATRICVDTAPLLERELAARAGLGAIGKNTNLLNPVFGSYFLLAEVLTTVELAPEAPVADLCGECRRCLDACPTGALPEAYRLDARRCISYWTIEHRGEIAAEVRPALGDWVFGCDVCQEVCPWNRDLPAVATTEFETSASSRELDLSGLLACGAEEFRQRFRGSPLLRAKLEGMQRNAALALAGATGRHQRAALERASRDPAPVVAEAASWSLLAAHRKSTIDSKS